MPDTELFDHQADEAERRRKRARADINRVSRAGLYSRPTIDAAAELLVDLVLAGERHGVERDAWSLTTDLPGACLDVAAAAVRGVDRVHRSAIEQGYPSPAALAVHLVDVVHHHLADELGALGVHRPGPYSITFSTCGRRRRSVKCTADGWDYDTDGPGRIVSIYAPCTDEGAIAVADLIAGLITGTTTDPLGRP